VNVDMQTICHTWKPTYLPPCLSRYCSPEVATPFRRHASGQIGSRLKARRLPCWTALVAGMRSAESSEVFCRTEEVVMKCELCSSGKRKRKQTLCLPRMEAMSRLWKIVNRLLGRL
jgi:hypothetical protein